MEALRLKSIMTVRKLRKHALSKTRPPFFLSLPHPPSFKPYGLERHGRAWRILSIFLAFANLISSNPCRMRFPVAMNGNGWAGITIKAVHGLFSLRHFYIYILYTYANDFQLRCLRYEILFIKVWGGKWMIFYKRFLNVNKMLSFLFV